LPGKGNPQLKLRLDLRILEALEIEARSRGLTAQQVVYALVEGYLAQVGGVVPPLPSQSESTLTEAIITKLELLLGQLRFEIASLDLTTVRRKRLKDLDRAARQLNRMAEQAADIEQRLKIYQVMGYLCQIIDGLLSNAQKDDIQRAMGNMEKRIELLEASRKMAKGDGGTPSGPGESGKPA